MEERTETEGHASILKRKSSDPREPPSSYHGPNDDYHGLPERQRTSNKDDDLLDGEDGCEGAGQRRQSVTFTTSSNEPCLDRRKLQRTPTPFHEILLAEGDKSVDSIAESGSDAVNASFASVGSAASNADDL